MSIETTPASDSDILSMAMRLQAERRAFVMATVIETQGSTSARPSAKAIFDRDGAVISGWVGGGCAESTVAHAAIECDRKRCAADRRYRS